jgi:hypothetical protein
MHVANVEPSSSSLYQIDSFSNIHIHTYIQVLAAMTDNNDDKEKKRRKMFKKMSKVLASCWQLPDATPFQDDSDEDDNKNKNGGGGKRRTSAVIAVVWKGFTLAPIGRKVDEKAYRFGRHGWEDFAADLGKVYNVHIQRYVRTACWHRVCVTL